MENLRMDGRAVFMACFYPRGTLEHAFKVPLMKFYYFIIMCDFPGQGSFDMFKI